MDEILIFLIGVWSVGIRLFYLPHKASYSNQLNFKTLAGFVIFYNIAHYIFFGKGGLFEIDFWWRIALSFLFVNLAFLKDRVSPKIIQITLIILFTRCCIELVIALLQGLEIVSISRNLFFKVSGSFTSTNYLAYSVVLGSILALEFIRKKSFKHTSLKVALMLLILVNISFVFFTSSRAAFIGTLAVLCFYFFKIPVIKKLTSNMSKSMLWASAGGVFLLGSFFFYAVYQFKIDSANGRLLAYRITLSEILKKPFWGNGLFTFQEGYNTAKSNYF